MIRPGARNLITDVAGITVGNAEDLEVRSGVSVVVPRGRAVAGVDVRGGAPGTRETDALDPTCLVDAVDAVVLSGGSAFGLAAADSVMNWLASQDSGFEVGSIKVPIVPAAILFDLINGGNKDWGQDPPYRRLAVEAAEGAAETFALGNSGAGLGATAGSLKGGLGSASFAWERDTGHLSVGALVAVNPYGSVVGPDGVFWVWRLEQENEFGGRRPRNPLTAEELAYAPEGLVGGNTTVAVVATDASLSPPQAQRLAIMAQDGLARAIRPVHTPFDGDTVFALATGQDPSQLEPADLANLGMLAADCVARAIARGVYEAKTLGKLTSYRDFYGLED